MNYLKKIILSFLLSSVIFFSDLKACSIVAYGTIGSYLFGTILQEYSVSNTCFIQAGLTSPYNSGVDLWLMNPSCSLASGNNLTVIQSNQIIYSASRFGGSNCYDVEVFATWTVAYNASLKAGVNVNVKYRNPDQSSPFSGGVDISMFYNYSSSNSSSTMYYCLAYSGTI